MGPLERKCAFATEGKIPDWFWAKPSLWKARDAPTHPSWPSSQSSNERESCGCLTDASPLADARKRALCGTDRCESLEEFRRCRLQGRIAESRLEGGWIIIRGLLQVSPEPLDFSNTRHNTSTSDNGVRLDNNRLAVYMGHETPISSFLAACSSFAIGTATRTRPFVYSAFTPFRSTFFGK
jgi:hypothetical protein